VCLPEAGPGGGVTQEAVLLAGSLGLGHDCRPFLRRHHPSGRLSREKQPTSEERVITVISSQAQENRKYVQRLLTEKLPEFAAMLESAERQLNQELWSHLDAGSARESQTVRHKDERRPLHLSTKGRRKTLPIFVTTLLCASARSGDGRGGRALIAAVGICPGARY
jgi:hypothetical protein